jgi:hypothetical protein
MDQDADKAAACWPGQEAATAPASLPNSCLQAVTVALTGFQVAIACSQPGRRDAEHSGLRHGAERNQRDRLHCRNKGRPG